MINISTKAKLYQQLLCMVVSNYQVKQGIPRWLAWPALLVESSNRTDNNYTSYHLYATTTSVITSSLSTEELWVGNERDRGSFFAKKKQKKIACYFFFFFFF